MNEAIYIRHREEIYRLRARLIGKCDKCEDGFIPVSYDKENGVPDFEECECKKRFEYLKGLCVANVPKGRWDILEQKRETIPVTSPYDLKRKLSLYSRYIKRIVKDIDKAIMQSVGLFMFGPTGTGKTTAAYYLIAKATKKGKSCYYIYFKNLIGLLLDSYSDREMKPLYEEIVRVQLLVVDELSLVGRVTPHAVAEFTSVLKERIERGSITVLISNYRDVDEIKENFGDPMESLMLEGFEGVRFFGKRDLREIRNERLQSFFK